MTAAASSTTIVAPITIKIDGTALDPKYANRLVEVKVRNSLLAPDMAQVKILDPVSGKDSMAFIESSQFRIGKSVEIQMGAPDARSTKPVFKGTIATLEPEFEEDSVVACFRAYDKSRILTRGRQSRVFKDMSTSDIMKKVLQESGFAPQVQATTVIHKWMQQTEESDWDFLWRLARSLDFVMVIDDAVAKVGPFDAIVRPGPVLQWGGGLPQQRLFSFLPTLSAAQVPKKVIAVAHDAMTNSEWVAEAVTFSQTMLATSKAASNVKADGKDIYKETSYRIATTGTSQGDVGVKAKAAASRLLQTAAEATGVAEGRPDLLAGTKVDIQKVGPFSGNYVISETSHVYRGGTGYRTQFICAGPAARSLGDMLAGASNGHPSYGSQIVIGTVTNNNDPDKLGRVKVKFSTLRAEGGTDAESWWARIASPSTGADRGLLMLPQVNEKVLIGFEHGDTSRPFVLGSLWHGQAKPGDDLTSKQDGSFVLRSDKQINMKAQKEVVVTAGKDFTVTVGGKSKIETQGNIDDKTTGSRTIKTTGQTTIESTGQMKIKASAPLEIQAPMISIKADAKLDLEGAMVNIKGSAAVVIDGGIIKLG